MPIKTDERFMYWSREKGGESLAIPFPDYGSAFVTSRSVDAGRNVLGVVVGQMVGRSASKQNMSWKALPCEKWWEINRWVEKNGMFFWCRYFDHNLGLWQDRRFYCGDFTCTPFGVDPETGKPQWYQDCSVNVIDTGE